MNTAYFNGRLSRDRVKQTVIIALLFWPVTEIIYFLYEIFTIGDAVLKPDEAFFLACSSGAAGHVFQSVFQWMLPMYGLILCADDCIVDYGRGYTTILAGRVGRKKYVKSSLKRSFLVMFCVIAASMFLNLMMVHIIFYGGKYTMHADELVMSRFLQWEIDYPFLANLLFLLIISAVSGLVSMAGTMIAIVLHNRKLVYGLSMLIWFILFFQKRTVVLLFQPHSEYLLDELVPLGLETFLVYLAVIVSGYCWEVYHETKIP